MGGTVLDGGATVKVGELIEKLKTLNPDLRVILSTTEWGWKYAELVEETGWNGLEFIEPSEDTINMVLIAG